MTLALGNVPASSVLYIPFHTYNASGASVTITGLAVTDIEIYKNGSVTQRASDSGYTLLDTDGIDFDGITGIHGFSIDLADNTDASFYAVGSTYWVVVSAITANAQTVNFVAAIFRIVAAEAVAGKPKVDVDAWLGTAAATPTVAGVPEVDVTHLGGVAGTFAAGRPEVNTTHAAGTAWNSNAISSATVAADIILEIADAIWDEDATGHQTQGTFGQAIGDPVADADTIWGLVNTNLNATVSSRASQTSVDTVDDFLDTEIAAIKAKTDNLPADPADASDVAAAIAGLNNLSAAQVNAEVVDALATDTYAEPGQGTPGATVSLATKVNYLYKALRNKKTTTATTFSLFNDDAVTVDQKATVSDDGATFTHTELATGP